ncbi:exodeoxyribonuclease VII small subunit [Reinekea thalattae]|uniref:Exodeoxyribonuclease 7 small subunit n=1 Tax=Reinekea thalattae TaxID=2593301 RepID=A0A5C8ZAS7_9GAMM|nr:exodeoxyribonuclease VII small subunit [Reinekea thalattae]TXR54288.1 exodeoxyribonuclease VII small subunit [Reinekea thalattae]
MASQKTAPFEENLASLEAIVNQLESGELSLDESLKQFEQGIALTRSCQESLAKAEQKVQILMSKDNQESLQDFEDLADE